MDCSTHAANADGNAKLQELDRPNLEILLDAVESTEKARVEKNSRSIVEPVVTRSVHRRNIDLLLDAVASATREAVPCSSSPSKSVKSILNGVAATSTSQISNGGNVVVEIVPYGGNYIREPSYGSQPPSPVKRHTTAPSEGAAAKRLRLKKLKSKDKKPARRDTDDERSYTEMVVPVDPRSLGRTTRTRVSSENEEEDIEGDGSNLLEVDVPIPFRTNETRERAHTQESIDFVLSHSLMKKFKPCPSCGNDVVLNTNNLTFRCSRLLPAAQQTVAGRRGRCQFKMSARVGTWFERACMSLQGMLHITFLWLMMRRPRHAYVRRQLRCSTKTVVDWASYCREVCVFWAESGSELIGGEGRTVELYEPNTVNRKRRGTEIMDGKWVFGGLDHASGKHFIVSVAERSREALLAAIKKWVRPDTIMVSDCWRSLKCMNDSVFRREMAKHGCNCIDPEKGEFTERVEQVWQEVRCSIPRSGPCDQQLIGCLSEFMFKRKFSEAEARTLHFFEVVAQLYPG